MHTLKVQLGLTLSVLLFISMLLFGFVILMLWQRNGITQEIRGSENLLYFAAASIAPGEVSANNPPFSDDIQSFFNDNGVLCLQWQNSPDRPMHSHGRCPEDLPLAPLLSAAATSTKTQTGYSGMSWNGFFLSKQYLLIATPLIPGQTNQGAIALIRSLDSVSSSIRETRKIFFAYLIINVLIFTTIGFTRLINLVIKPIERLSRLADSRTDLDATPFLSGERLGEFTQLSLSLNRLVTRIDGDKQELRHSVESLKNANDELQKNRDEMIRAEKLASIGRLSAGLAHEIGNPLGIIQGYIDLLTEQTLSSSDRKAFSKRATQELDRINTLIRNLLDLSRTPVTSSAETIDIHPLLTDLIQTVRVRKTRLPIRYSTDFQATASEVLSDSDGLRQVFLNCILNSIDAIEETVDSADNSISIHTENMVSKNERNCIITTIKDTGAGISKETQEAIFDPFFTTKEVGKGTGLGLAVAHNLIKKSGGTISISSKRGRGTSVIITLPLSLSQKK